jgi:hypothetical protein
MEDKLERIATALERIADIMENADRLRRRRTINEMNEKRQKDRLKKKTKKHKLPEVDSDKIRKTN